MSERPNYIGGMDRPDWYDRDVADMRDAADDAHRQDDTDDGPETWPDVEWSSEQTFAGEFGITTAFGESID